MEANNEMTLRKADNKVHVEGILKEMNLKHTNQNNENVVNGSIVILVEDGEGQPNEITVNAFAKQYTKTHDENKAYINLSKFMENATSMAHLMSEQGGSMTEEDAKSHATRVKCSSGTLGVNEYYTPAGILTSRTRIDCNYLRIVQNDSFAPAAEFDVELFFTKIVPEYTKDQEETGRVLIDAILPIYGGKVVPISFVAEGDSGEYIKDNYKPNASGHVWGRIVSTVERKETVQQGFGRAKKEVSVTYKSELMIDGGEEEQYEDDDKKSFPVGAIKNAWKVRETETLPALLQKSKTKDSKPAASFNNSGAPAKSSFKW